MLISQTIQQLDEIFIFEMDCFLRWVHESSVKVDDIDLSTVRVHHQILGTEVTMSHTRIMDALDCA